MSSPSWEVLLCEIAGGLQMRRSTATVPCVVLTVILTGLIPNGVAHSQSQSASLQLGVPLERTLTRGQSHSFTVSLEQDQFLQLVVNQLGIDVVVRVFSPAGKMLGEFDS